MRDEVAESVSIALYLSDPDLVNRLCALLYVDCEYDRSTQAYRLDLREEQVSIWESAPVLLLQAPVNDGQLARHVFIPWTSVVLITYVK